MFTVLLGLHADEKLTAFLELESAIQLIGEIRVICGLMIFSCP